MKQNQQFRGIGLVLLVIALITFASSLTSQGSLFSQEMTHQEFMVAVENKTIESVDINQNQQPPTGILDILLKSGDRAVVAVSDVKEAEKLLRENSIDYIVENVPQENYLMSVIIPVALSAVVIMFMFMFMNARLGGGGGGNSKMMNFGKSRAKMSRTNSVNFSKVAGLEEEKEELEEIVDFLKNPKKYTDVLGTSVKGRLNTLVHNVIINSVDRPVIQMSEEVHEAMQGLRVFMFENVYRNPVAKKEEGKAIHMITNLYEFYIKNPGFLPEQSQNMLKKGEELSRVVCDYIAGMTDTYAVKKFTEFFIPESWKN